jgi:hypothetical protein
VLRENPNPYRARGKRGGKVGRSLRREGNDLRQIWKASSFKRVGWYSLPLTSLFCPKSLSLSLSFSCTLLEPHRRQLPNRGKHTHHPCQAAFLPPPRCFPSTRSSTVGGRFDLSRSLSWKRKLSDHQDLRNKVRVPLFDSNGASVEI